MNREIKFRGKPINQEWWLENFERFASMEEWAIGNLIVSDGECWIVGGIADVDDEYIAHEWWVRVRPKTVGQYTGLKDRNGVKIWEGDVFHLGDPNILYVVVWQDAGLVGRQRGNRSSVGLSYWAPYLEIVGNIHDNPELLEVLGDGN